MRTLVRDLLPDTENHIKPKYLAETRRTHSNTTEGEMTRIPFKSDGLEIIEKG